MGYAFVMRSSLRSYGFSGEASHLMVASDSDRCIASDVRSDDGVGCYQLEALS